MNVEIRPTAAGASIAVRAQPGAKKEKITGVHDSALKISVTAPPEDGRANEALTRFLAKSLGRKPDQVQILQGKTDRRKVFEILGMNAEELQTLVNEILKNLAS